MLRALVAHHHRHIYDLHSGIVEVAARKREARFLNDLRIGTAAQREPALQGPRADPRDLGGKGDIGTTVVEIGLNRHAQQINEFPSGLTILQGDSEKDRPGATHQ